MFCISNPNLTGGMFIGHGLEEILSARKGHKTLEGYYNIERMLQSIVHRGSVPT